VKRGHIVLVTLAGLAVFFVVLAWIGGNAAPQTTAAAPQVTVTVTEQAEAPTAEPQPTVTITETVKAEPPKPKAVIEEGTWLVGEDIPAGNFKTTETVEDGCYWEISKGSSIDDIIDNANPQGGYPRVSLKKGQIFTTEGCGSWAKR